MVSLPSLGTKRNQWRGFRHNRLFFALLLGLVLFRKNIRFSLIFNGKAHLLLWIGLFAGWANIAYITSIVYGEIMRVMLLFYLAPLWTPIFAHMLLNERLSLYGYLVIALSLSGATTILWQPAGTFSTAFII
jgi:drug/metabolite transporter (DMT)-like permease